MATNLTQIANIIKGMAPKQPTYATSGNNAMQQVHEALQYPDNRMVQQPPKPVKSTVPVAHPVNTETSYATETPKADKSIESFKRLLVKGKDYGELPNVKGAVLFKPGALRFLRYFQYRKTEELVDKTINFSCESVFISYTVKVTIINSAGEIITEALGSCNSHESKYSKKGASADNVLVAMASKRALVSAVKELLAQ